MILDTLVAHARAAGYRQCVVVGVPADDVPCSIGGLDADHIRALRFEQPGLEFPVPGMSDVMPYRSTVWSRMDADMLERYRGAWRAHLRAVVEAFRPDLIHAHHLWLVTSMLRDVAPDTPIVVQCHGTGLRQMQLCPGLAEEVRSGCARADHFQVPREDHVGMLRAALGVGADRITVVPAGYREDVFHAARDRTGGGRRLLYVGKYSAAKGLPQLLDAVDTVSASTGGAGVELHVAGSGSGPEADALRARMTAQAHVTMHGQLDQPALAELMRASDVCVLPSFYEGVPLVLVEAAACGCRLVATALPGVVRALAPALGRRLVLVEPPAMVGVDTPDVEAVPAFTARLREAIERALLGGGDAASERESQPDLREFGWAAVFERVQSIWTAVTDRA